MTLRFAQIGNFGPEHSTENELRKAIENNGHVAVRHQEDDGEAWSSLTRAIGSYDVVLWTRTASLSPDHETQRRMLDAARAAQTPVIGVHLDRWVGLARQREIRREPYFTVDVLFTADGGHQAEWAALGVNHRWLPPAVGAAECGAGEPRDEYRSPLAFVGSWRGGYHPEWQHRARLVRWLSRNYRGRVAFWPQPGQHAVRGAALRDLYASVDVVVGDSCLVPRADGRPCTSYVSDRLPETIGRGGFFIHPHVNGITDGGMVESGTHLATWPLGDFDALRERIEWALGHPAERREIAAAGMAHVAAHHTYDRRVAQVVDVLRAEGLIDREAA